MEEVSCRISEVRGSCSKAVKRLQRVQRPRSLQRHFCRSDQWASTPGASPKQSPPAQFMAVRRAVYPGASRRVTTQVMIAFALCSPPSFFTLMQTVPSAAFTLPPFPSGYSYSSSSSSYGSCRFGNLLKYHYQYHSSSLLPSAETFTLVGAKFRGAQDRLRIGAMFYSHDSMFCRPHPQAP